MEGEEEPQIKEASQWLRDKGSPTVSNRCLLEGSGQNSSLSVSLDAAVV